MKKIDKKNNFLLLAVFFEAYNTYLIVLFYVMNTLMLSLMSGYREYDGTILFYIVSKHILALLFGGLILRLIYYKTNKYSTDVYREYDVDEAVGKKTNKYELYALIIIFIYGVMMSLMISMRLDYTYFWLIIPFDYLVVLFISRFLIRRA